LWGHLWHWSRSIHQKVSITPCNQMEKVLLCCSLLYKSKDASSHPEICQFMHQRNKAEMEKCSSGWWCWNTKNAWLLMFVKLFFYLQQIHPCNYEFFILPLLFHWYYFIFCEVKRAQPPSIYIYIFEWSTSIYKSTNLIVKVLKRIQRVRNYHILQITCIKLNDNHS